MTSAVGDRLRTYSLMSAPRIDRFPWRWTALAVLVLLLLFPVLYDWCQVARMRSAATRVLMGDSAAQVRTVLGEPNTVFPKMTHGFNTREFETWAYGSHFEWSNCLSGEFPFFFPFRLRLFGPDPDDDVVLEFDDEGTVVRIGLP